MTHEVIDIGFADSNGISSTVVVAPLDGGTVRAFYSEVDGEQHHWLRAADEDHPACFPMVPFCSRIRHGRFSSGGTAVRLRSANATDDHPIHGHGCYVPWRVLHRERSRLVLEYEHSADAWPWHYIARQTFLLTERGLQIELSVRNTSGQEMPAGLGIHPYLPKLPGTRVQARVERWLQLDAQLLPIGLASTPQDLDLQAGMDLGAREFDHVFSQWSGEARVDWPERKASLRLLRLSDSAPNHLVLWAPDAADFFCLEPVSNLPDGFNLSERFSNRYVRVAPHATYAECWLLSPGWH